MDTNLHRILQTDWSFPDASGSFGVHKLHWYPATFIPQIPAYLIELLSQAGDTVIDPFCGAGTTCVEAMRLGRMSLGADSNPLACLISGAKVQSLTAEEMDQIERFLNDRLVTTGAGDTLPFGLDKSGDPRLAGVSAWFHESTYMELCEIRSYIRELPEKLQLFPTVVLSSILKKCSSQTKHWGYVADNVLPRDHVYVPARRMFLDHLSDAHRAKSNFLASLPPSNGSQSAWSEIVRCSAEDLSHAPLADLIVTSPPYLNVTDYSDSQRISFDFLGLDLEASRAKETGARWKRFRRTAYEAYRREMQTAILNLASLLKPGKYACLVVGGSSVGGIEPAELFLELSEEAGLIRCIDPLRRTLSRQRLLDKNGTKREEAILILRRES